MSETITKIVFIVALYVSFLFSGIFEEKLYKGNYVDSNNKKLKYSSPLLAIFLNNLVSFIISGAILMTR
jgi:hypothetical protein